jgi:hypothetical protein
MSAVDLDMVQRELKARLESDEYFQDIPVIDYRQANLQSELEKMISGLTGKAGKNGIFAYLSGFVANVGDPDVSGPLFDGIGFNAVIFELPLINMGSTGTRKPALQTAIRLAQVLHQYRPEGISETILVRKEAIRQTDTPDDSAVSYSVPVMVPAHIDPPAKCAVPVLDVPDAAAPQTVTITCATAGAAVWYTLNDSYPSPLNPAATLYTAPVLVATAAALRAVAYKTGTIASDSALGIYT